MLDHFCMPADLFGQVGAQTNQNSPGKYSVALTGGHCRTGKVSKCLYQDVWPVYTDIESSISQAESLSKQTGSL